jgi:hypothetical protein
VPGERGVQLDADFQIDHTVEVDCDVPARSRDLLRADDVPHGTASFRNDLREFVWFRAPADHRQRTAGELFDADDVIHVRYSVCWISGLGGLSLPRGPMAFSGVRVEV